MIRAACGTAAAGFAIGLVVESQARLKLERENEAYHPQLRQIELAVSENQRLSNLLAQARGAGPRQDEDSRLTAPSDKAELLRLRGEVHLLRQEKKELESLREDTRQTRAALESRSAGAGRVPSGGSGPGPNGSQFELVRAEYWTPNARLDVTDELRDRIRGDSLKAMASNNLKGDPEFGQVKHLTVEYRVGGVTLTNEFREGDVIVLPAEPQ